MRVNLAAIGKFHFFDLAQQLDKRGSLQNLYTGYPRWKIESIRLPREQVNTYPWLHTPYMWLQRQFWAPPWASRQLEYINKVSFDKHTARIIDDCDVFTGISSCALETGRLVKTRGSKYICDRGSTHIVAQDQILQDEHLAWGLPTPPIDQRIVDREEAEYAEADLITVPSTFAKQTFVSKGIPESKIALIPYGVDLRDFYPVGEPDKRYFTVTFVGGMSLRKGIQYLVQAFTQLQVANKRLQFIGQIDPLLISRLKALRLWPDQVQMRGHVEQSQLKQFLSSSDVLVLPSVEDGFGLVMAQAMACGCPVIASENTGAVDLYTHSVEGYIVPPRDVSALKMAMESIADDSQPQIRRIAAQQNVARLGGWDKYGDAIFDTYKRLCK